MGDRQSVVVLKADDWCVYQCDEAVDIKPRLCRVSYVKGDKVAVYWADLDMQLGYADKQYLTPLPEGLTPILSDSITTETKTRWRIT